MKLGHAQKVFGFKSDTEVLTFTFRFLSSLFFCFSCLIFWLLLGIMPVGFILVEKVFRKAVKILGLDERKGKWVVEQDFHGNITWFFAFSSGVLD